MLTQVCCYMASLGHNELIRQGCRTAKAVTSYGFLLPRDVFCCQPGFGAHLVWQVLPSCNHKYETFLFVDMGLCTISILSTKQNEAFRSFQSKVETLTLLILYELTSINQLTNIFILSAMWRSVTWPSLTHTAHLRWSENAAHAGWCVWRWSCHDVNEDSTDLMNLVSIISGLVIMVPANG